MDNIRLLLIEHQNDILYTIANALEQNSIIPVPAHNTSEALVLLQDDPVDVALLDDSFYGENGLEEMRLIKAGYPDIQVIFLTQKGTIRNAVTHIKAGAFDYLTKPVDTALLIDIIRHAYRQQKKSEEERKEERFRQKVEQQTTATERLASLGTLAAGVAHEINNPLAIIKEVSGWLNTLLNDKGMEDIPHKQEFEENLKIIDKTVERARNITHQLMYVIRKTDAKIVQIELTELINETLQIICNRLTETNIRIIKKMDPSPVIIWCDPNLLRQVIVNLLNNGCDAMGNRGDLVIGLKQLDDVVALEIRDSGQGIPKENLERIFEPFFSTKSPGKGTGLGLYVTKSIIDSLGGTLHLESEMGRGTRIMIKLPKFCKLKERYIRDDFNEPLNRLLNQNPLK